MKKLSITYSSGLKTQTTFIETESQFVPFYTIPLRCQQFFDFF